MKVMRETIRSLLESEQQYASEENNEETTTTPTLMQHQAKLCQKLVRNLKKIQSPDKFSVSSDDSFLSEEDDNENDESSHLTIRTLLGNIPWTELSSLTEILAHIMSNRVEMEALLPMTQDVEANMEAMNNNAITLTPASFVSAELYAQLIATPGALGAGLVEMESLSALLALLRRWRIECGEHESIFLKAKQKEEKQNDDEEEGEVVQPVKRSRRNRRNAESDSESDSDTMEGDCQSRKAPGGDLKETSELSLEDALSPSEIALRGLFVARIVCQVPLLNEFIDWSSEAREIVMDLITSVLATSSALLGGCSKAASRRQVGKEGQALSQLAEEVVRLASDAIGKCVLVSHNQASEGDENANSSTPNSKIGISLAKRHETVVSILRGLIPIITMCEELPKGVAGKLSAAEAASKAFSYFVWVVSKDHSFGVRDKMGEETTPATTPAATRRLSIGSRGTSGRKRLSLGGNENFPVTPKLKSAGKIPAISATPSASTSRARPLLSVILGALQKLTTCRGLEKAAVRRISVESIHHCLEHLPVEERSHFLKFLAKLCRAKFSLHRLVASELIGLVLPQKWLWRDHNLDEVESSLTEAKEIATPASASSKISLMTMETRKDSTLPSALFEALMGRLVDRETAIRMTAAAAFTEVLCKVEAAADTESGENTSSPMDGLVECLSENSSSLADSLRTRSLTDEKAMVRRSAIVALIDLLKLAESDSICVHLAVSETDVAILNTLCQDKWTLIRRTAAEGLSVLLELCQQMPPDKHSEFLLKTLEESWAKAVLPLALDPENSCVSKAVELAHRIVLSPILNGDDSNDSTTVSSSYQSAWRILSTVGDSSEAKGGSRSWTEALRVVVGKQVLSANCSMSFLKKMLQTIHRVAVQTLDEEYAEDLLAPDIDSQRAGVWCLFEATMNHSKDFKTISKAIQRCKIDLAFLVTSWEKILKLTLSMEKSGSHASTTASLLLTMQKCLQVLSSLASCVDRSISQGAADKLRTLLCSFSLPPEIIGASVTALVATTLSSNGNKTPHEQRQECRSVIQAIFQACEDKIASIVEASHTSIKEEDIPTLVRVCFTVGEVSLIGFVSGDDDDENFDGSGDDATTGRQMDVVRSMQERPSNQLIDLVQALMPPQLPGVSGAKTPNVLRAHAFTTLGKLCIRDKRLASKSVNIFARELHDKDRNSQLGEVCREVQSNALVVLGDLCVKYTIMADRHLPVMASCLQTGVTEFSTNDLLSAPVQQGSGVSALVRKNAVLLLSSLLLQDYIKWRGLLFHRFLVASADQDEEVAELSTMVLAGPLISKYPKLFFNNFVESIFVLNRCTAHPVYAAAAATGDGGSGIAVGFEGIYLTGETGRAMRSSMYQMMLGKMTDEEKLGITVRLAKEVLGAALEGGDLNRVCTNSMNVEDPAYETAFAVMSDAFAILSSPEIRVGKFKQQAEDETIEEPNNRSSSRRVVVARGRFLAKISRKHLIESILPILCRLKTVLQKSQSKLLKDLLSYLVDSVYRSFKTEVTDFLANDPNLLKEIEYDAKQFNRAQKQGRPSMSALTPRNKRNATTPTTAGKRTVTATPSAKKSILKSGKKHLVETESARKQ